ncbi:hypothetical protein [Sphingobacterium sp. T2]|uniref:hypothetical protein n=1 Tax=Sphingobacterium sp. T2 TaxID=1590596 RepID=UPI00057B9ECA|nr:hypothetical protein [Sphingobacterium sp. T2]
MAKMFNNIEDLIDEMVYCFNERVMFNLLEERDIISVLPIEEADNSLRHRFRRKPQGLGRLLRNL